MQQYPVPQFIQQEGRIIFFLSFKQFFYLVGAGLVCFFLYYLLPTTLFYILAPIVFIVAAAMAFVKINNMTLPELLLSTIGFSIGGKSYVWKKKESPYPFKPVKRAKIHKLDKGPVLQVHPSQLKKAKMNVELRNRNNLK